MNFKIWLGIALIVFVIFLIFIYKEKIKKKLQERIEKNSVKIPNIIWTKRNGEEVREDVIMKKSGIPLIGDWGRIYPAIDEDGKAKWINLIFGGKKNFIKLLLFLGLIALFLLGYYEIFQSFETYRESCIQINGTIIP